MDGLEWKRIKYNKYVQRFLMFAEKLAVKNSDILIADSEAIKDYLFKKYAVQACFIAYGAELFDKPNDEILNQFGLVPFTYNMLIARMEPENNIEMILDGVKTAKSNAPFFVVGNPNNKFGHYLVEKFKSDKRIVFAGSIYDAETINNLRYYSCFYFHGHSVGGTNPSLLEAMGCKSLIVAHNNAFNKSVLGENSLYFQDAQEVANLLDNCKRNDFEVFLDNNYNKIKTEYTWEKIISQYEKIIIMP